MANEDNSGMNVLVGFLLAAVLAVGVYFYMGQSNDVTTADAPEINVQMPEVNVQAPSPAAPAPAPSPAP